MTHIGSTQKYWYDENGNQTTRIYGPDTYTQIYDAENRLVSVSGTNLSAQFTYNGDGQKVKSVIDGETTYLVNGYYEMKGSEITKYYLAGATRIAARSGTGGTLRFLLSDHLGSSSVTTDANGALTASALYKAFGEVRWTTPNKPLPTRYTFTGQCQQRSHGFGRRGLWVDVLSRSIPSKACGQRALVRSLSFFLREI